MPVFPGSQKSSVLRRAHCLGPQLQQQQNQAKPQKDMPNPRHAGKSCVHTGSEGKSPHLGHTPHRQHHGGEVQAGVIKGQGPAGLRAGKGKALFQHKQQKKNTMPIKK